MIKQYWQQLSSRERRMVSAMAIVVGISLFYFGFWSPLHKGIEKNHHSLGMKTSQLKNMQQYASEARRLRASGGGAQQVANRESLLVTIERTAKQKKLPLQQIKPDSDDGVRLTLENVAFDRMIEWLNLLEVKHGIRVTDIAVERQKKRGQVNGRILLQVSS